MRIHRGEAMTGAVTVGASLLAAVALLATLAIVLFVIRSIGFPIFTLAP